MTYDDLLAFLAAHHQGGRDIKRDTAQLRTEMQRLRKHLETSRVANLESRTERKRTLFWLSFGSAASREFIGGVREITERVMLEGRVSCRTLFSNPYCSSVWLAYSLDRDTKRATREAALWNARNGVEQYLVSENRLRMVSLGTGEGRGELGLLGLALRGGDREIEYVPVDLSQASLDRHVALATVRYRDAIESHRLRIRPLNKNIYTLSRADFSEEGRPTVVTCFGNVAGNCDMPGRDEQRLLDRIVDIHRGSTKAVALLGVSCDRGSLKEEYSDTFKKFLLSMMHFLEQGGAIEVEASKAGWKERDIEVSSVRCQLYGDKFEAKGRLYRFRLKLNARVTSLFDGRQRDEGDRITLFEIVKYPPPFWKRLLEEKRYRVAFSKAEEVQDGENNKRVYGLYLGLK